MFKLFLPLSFDIFLFHVSSVLGEQDEGRDGDEAGEHLLTTSVLREQDAWLANISIGWAGDW